MKKTLVTLLALVFVLGIGATAFAAPANPFVDVPAKHWAYDAVSKLAKAGLVDGYNDGTFRGDKAMSRYEMAQVVAKAMAKSDKADAEMKALIDKLAVEFAAELNNLGVRVTALEKKVDNTKFSADIRARYDNKSTDVDGTKYADNGRTLRTRLTVKGQINDEWVYTGRFQNVQNLSSSGGDNETLYNYAYVSGPLLGANVNFGRMPYFVGYGLVADSDMDGINVGFGKELKFNLWYGRSNLKSVTYNYADGTPGKALMTVNDVAGNDTAMTVAELKYAMTPDTNIIGAYHDYKTKGESNANRIWELGFDTKLSADWVLYGSYAKSNATEQNKAWVAGVTYKAYDKSKPGSYDFFMNYRNTQEFATWDSTFDNTNLNYKDSDDLWGSKGFEVGFHYVPAKNMMWMASYQDMKSTKKTAAGNDIKTKFFKTELHFYF